MNISFERRETGLRCRNARIRAGVGQEYVAAKLGVSQATLSRIERGHNFPSLPQVMRLAELYGVEPSYLAFGGAA